MRARPAYRCSQYPKKKVDDFSEIAGQGADYTS